MDSIDIEPLDGPEYVGTWWAVKEGQRKLEVYETQQKAIDKARSRWAYPDQAIRLTNKNGQTRTIREATVPDEDDHGGGGGGGPLPGMDTGLPGTGDNGGGGLF